ncbi:MAG TPA: hypothetical protein VIQ62_08245 [Burkholderiales bacterium]|jgi:hypothetical protein
MSFKTVFDPHFKYRPADCTDLRLTFARIRRAQQRAQRRADAGTSSKVVGRIAPAANSAAAQNGSDWPFPVNLNAPTGEGQA